MKTHSFSSLFPFSAFSYQNPHYIQLLTWHLASFWNTVVSISCIMMLSESQCLLLTILWTCTNRHELCSSPHACEQFGKTIQDRCLLPYHYQNGINPGTSIQKVSGIISGSGSPECETFSWHDALLHNTRRMSEDSSEKSILACQPSSPASREK